MAIKRNSCVKTLFLVLLTALSSAGNAYEVAFEERPKIGLVLSGGGARGAAHVGVLKILEELRIPIDYVAGTSMGAIVGGLYASGMSVEEIASVIGSTDWKGFYSDRQPRSERSLRRKSDGNGFLVDFDVGFKNGGLVFPLGLVQGQKFEIALRRWLLPVATVKDFDRLPIPFRAVATDVAKGELVLLGSGDLASAIRASMSAPGALKPVRLDGRLLVDGGLVNKLPVQVVKDMGADLLIVVDVGFPLLEEDKLNSVLAVSNQMLTIMIQGNVRRQLDLLGDSDVLITPELGHFSSTAFDRVVEAMARGENSARNAQAKLSGLSVDNQA
jgi:NTE family protein